MRERPPRFTHRFEMNTLAFLTPKGVCGSFVARQQGPAWFRQTWEIADMKASCELSSSLGRARIHFRQLHGCGYMHPRFRCTVTRVGNLFDTFTPENSMSTAVGSLIGSYGG